MIHDKSEKYQYRYLDDAELLAALSGIRLEQAVEILQQYRLHEIEDYLDGLTPKLTERQKRAILSAFELSRRIFSRPPEKQYLVKTPQELVMYLERDMRYMKKEIFVCIHLNTKNAVVRKETISIGSLNASIVHPREVFSNAVKHSTSGVILCHNHPSGDPRPSCEDLETTKRLVDAGNVLGIKVLDHIIIGNGEYISMKEKGFI
ncbi:MAG: DNA repair protein RadC [Ruminiclostridium sp.]|nr:DNA repair protein RadC [Ruminiclostridium sp.]